MTTCSFQCAIYIHDWAAFSCSLPNIYSVVFLSHLTSLKTTGILTSHLQDIGMWVHNSPSATDELNE